MPTTAKTEDILRQPIAIRRWIAATLLALTGCATTSPHATQPLQPGSLYVALGSSYAAGVGIGPIVPGTPKRCGQTVNNYPRLLAERLGLHLVDASCGGATTANILGPWSELPAQIAAVAPDTRLVTVTIGGNDVGYVRDLFQTMCRGARCPSALPITDADWATLERNMRQIARDVQQRAPRAKLVFVDYLRIIPDGALCPAVALNPDQAALSRGKFRRLASLTARVARDEGAMLLPAGKLSDAHHACSTEPWAQAFPAKAAPWHPTAAGHAAIADALARKLAPG